jgi:RHS repeat-associated protein
VTNSEGRQHERIEYTPYGELWVEHRYEAEEGALPYRFTGKELDGETGFYYYGARYLDPKTSRWISGDPALGEYIPGAPVNDEVRKQNQNLPGGGGIYNLVNLHVYHYAGNNPLKYTDPDGKADKPSLVSRMINLFKNDGSTQIQTIGVAASGTVTMVSGAAGAGIYVNHKNEKLQTIASALTINPMTVLAGALLTAINIEDAGVYVEASAGAGGGISGSITASASEFKSLDAAKGGYLEFGGSAGEGIIGGVDIVTNIRANEVIGATISVGIGAGTAEGHDWVGVSGFFSVKDFFVQLFTGETDE